MTAPRFMSRCPLGAWYGSHVHECVSNYDTNELDKLELVELVNEKLIPNLGIELIIERMGINGSWDVILDLRTTHLSNCKQTNRLALSQVFECRRYLPNYTQLLEYFGSCRDMCGLALYCPVRSLNLKVYTIKYTL